MNNNREVKNIKQVHCLLGFRGKFMWLEPGVFVGEAAEVELEVRDKMPPRGAGDECLQYCAIELDFTCRRDVFSGIVIPTIKLMSK